MTITPTALSTRPSRHAPVLPGAPERAPEPETLTRAQLAGAFSIIGNGPLTLVAEAGMLIRIRAGAMWVPQPEFSCSTWFGAGEQVRVRQAGPMTLLPERGTEIELDWPRPLH